MDYYFGTSEGNYKLMLASGESQSIHCRNCPSLVFGFAYSDAEKDEGSPVVLKITSEKDFRVTPHGEDYLLEGILTKENHQIYRGRDLNKLILNQEFPD